MERAVAVWNEITTDFDPEEETANFGTRHALEADGNLYEVGAECLERCADKTSRLELRHVSMLSKQYRRQCSNTTLQIK